ncbi:hypothetical protein Ait01nite_043040 [Actinoplanes italicus]|uniref:HEAT repeat protein n=1 Tax=Actinoplanes italicus TaxID=113567 RepID=A0A2T0KC16_9ACTN|nr:DUF6493 family protein [Actinoplanes italicus]PRX20784.1 hypothetical protein CLV67_10761 [Actinoplanes italicus]GIE31259.1 hypothetical protein Ait01nite_043040 [Actinoplanes italicus]
MTLDWETVDRRARSGDQPGVARLFLEATEAERLAFTKQFEAGLRAVDPDVYWRARVDPAPGYAIAVIGAAPSAARAATLLLKRGIRDSWQQIQFDRVLQVAEARELDWLGDLGLRLAARLPTRDVWDGGDWAFTARFLRAGGTPPPVTEGVVRGWLARLIRPRRERVPPLSIRMREDPDLDVLLPGVFEIDGMGSDIFNATWGEDSALPKSAIRFHQAVAALVAEGRLERKAILTATIDRLARGDKPNALRPFVLLHDELDPAVDEIAAHALDYARLLAEGPGAVATVAQRCLRVLDDTGRLDADTLLETSFPVLLRKEKTLVKAQITWLEKVARREPERADEVFGTVSAAFGHPALDIQERAFTLVAKHLPGLAPDTVARLAEASVVLAGDLPARAAALFGTTVLTETVPELPPHTGPAPMPPPITTAAELAEEIAVLVHEESGVRWERVLAAFVALHADGGRGSLTAALSPLLDRYPGDLGEHPWNEGEALACLGAAITMAIDPARQDGVHRRLHETVRIARQEGRRGENGSRLSPLPDGVLALRVAEIAVHLNGSMMPMLVATPTHVSGSLDAAVLLDRLSRAEAEGWQPWPFDLEQALLRLPRGPVSADVTTGVAALASPAGRQFAQWLASGGLPDPISERVVQQGKLGYLGAYDWDRPVARRMLARLRPARDGGLRLERQLLTLAPPDELKYMPDDLEGAEEVVAMVLPHHREVAAAWALPEMAALADQDQQGSARLLPLLAEGTGPIGPALSAAMAYAFCAKQESDRVAAVDAFLTLTAGTEPFAGRVGEALGDLCSDSTAKLGRALPALTDAHRSGASAAVWELLAAALPPLLPTKVRGVPDLLELATQVAVTLGARTEIPGLADIAARPGASRLVQEAKRLQSTLAP